MYHSKQSVDTREYPERCPSCGRKRYLEEDWETGLHYCQYCGWDPDNDQLLNWTGGTDGESDPRRRE